MIFHIALLFAWQAAAHDGCATKAISMVQTRKAVSQMHESEGEGLLSTTGDLTAVATRSSEAWAHSLFLQHASRSAHFQQANEQAIQNLQATKDQEKHVLALLQTLSLTTPAPNLTAHHENRSSHYKQEFLDANATQCRACGKAEEALITATQAALTAHTEAQNAAAFLSRATKNYAIAAQGFGDANKEYTQIANQMCPITLTYNAAVSTFDSIAAAAQNLKQKALIAQQHNAWEMANKTIVDAAQAQYDAAAAKATAADQPIAARKAAAAAACASIVAVAQPTLEPTPMVKTCPQAVSSLSDFSSRKAMTSAGWTFTGIEDASKYGTHFQGWGGYRWGSLEATLNAVGVLYVTLKNGDNNNRADNFVRLLKNGVEIERLGGWEEKTINVAFSQGDKIKIDENRATIILKQFTATCYSPAPPRSCSAVKRSTSAALKGPN
eukprot:CAMPEP_0172785126 /NCGR_PEP_ID=MMETSP1074-20121228/205288_1 /TAXON_ID=2916 /ORGANISM="Ceratium fusus, Strain PA161109" /LENGTH=439 /DNA_ID=CAMNT_0013622131 /DNA_START=18 /DNA_END=1334 /DNA_ORIENTATION=+